MSQSTGLNEYESWNKIFFFFIYISSVVCGTCIFLTLVSFFVSWHVQACMYSLFISWALEVVETSIRVISLRLEKKHDTKSFHLCRRRWERRCVYATCISACWKACKLSAQRFLAHFEAPQKPWRRLKSVVLCVYQPVYLQRWKVVSQDIFKSCFSSFKCMCMRGGQNFSEISPSYERVSFKVCFLKCINAQPVNCRYVCVIQYKENLYASSIL